MNAILGQMKVDQTRAMPAYVVNLDVGLSYIISTVKGNFNPCVSCTKDKWFNGFSAFPSSTLGEGLKWVGHTSSKVSGGR